MATNTNYTTRTASLRATKADVRKVDARQVAVTKKIEIGSGDTATQITDSKVSAEDLFVSVDGKEDRQSVKALIQQAQTDATNAAGIQVTRDLTGDYDNADDGEVLNVKTKKMNFFGSFVNVVQSDKNPDEISIYIGENKNPAEFDSTMTSPGGDGTQRYVYSGDDYSVGSFKTNNSTKYTTTQAQSTNVSSDTETVYGGKKESDNKGTVYTIPNKSTTVKLEALQGSNVIASAETAAIDGTSTTATAVAKVGENDAMTLTVEDIVENTSDDAKDGLTPGFIRCKIKATVRNSYLLPDGGAYKLKLTVGSKSATSDELYVWKSRPDNLVPSVGSVTATYTPTSDKTRTVSGITYDTAATCAISVTDVANTQYMQGTSLNRLKVTDDSNAVASVGSSGTLTTANLTGTNTGTNSAVYSYSGSPAVTSSSPEIISATITAQAMKADGGAAAGAAKTATMTGQVNRLWTVTDSTDTDAISYFTNDGKRLSYAVVADATTGDVQGLTISGTGAWTSTTDITNTKDALIQDSKLMHPKNDVTGKYSSATGTRYYTKLIKVGTTGAAVTTFLITASGGGLTAPGVKLWAVPAQDGAGKTQGGYAYQLNSNANATELSDTAIKLTISGNTMTCLENSSFYLVVQIPDGSAKIGAITVAKV